MENIFNIIQIVLAVILVIVILFQNRGAGLGSVFGGGESGNVYQSKRGFDKILFYSTIGVSVIFFGVAIANVLIRQ